MAEKLAAGTVLNADCIEALEESQTGFADLVFADPPFNIGYQYDVYEDRLAYEEYHAWTEAWMRTCAQKALKPTGSFWVAIGDEYAAEVRLIGRKLGLTLRNWVIWHYTFGQNTKAKFSRSHAHLFYFVKDPAEFTFNDAAVRVFSDRQRVYRDRRANPAGRIPDDTWGEFPRLCGTFAEREGWHPCQMPESILVRIVRSTSNPGEVVFDPFGRSGTTLAAAKRSGRRYAGTELSPDYHASILQRLEGVRSLEEASRDADPWPAEIVQELKWCYAEEQVSPAALSETPHLLEAFAGHFNARLEIAGAGRRYEPRDLLAMLARLGCCAELPVVKEHVRSGSARTRPKVDEASPRRKPTRAPAGNGLFG